MQTNTLYNEEKVFHKIIVFLAYTLVFVTPFLYYRNLQNIFEVPKIFLNYILIATIIFIYLLRHVHAYGITGNLHIIKTLPLKALFPLFAFLGANIVSFIFTDYKLASLWGYGHRFSGGLVFIFLLVFLMYIVIDEFSAYEKAMLTQIILAASIPVCLYSIAQHFGYQKELWEVDTQVRVISTIGQPNWLAAYNSMLIVLPLYFYLKNNINVKSSLYYVSLILLNFTSLWFTYSLSGLLSYIISLGFFCIGFYLLHNKIFEKVIIKKFLLINFLCFIIAVFNLGVIKPRIQFAFEDIINSLTNRPKSLQPVKESDDTTKIRLALWKGTYDIVASSPKVLLVGVGPETYTYSFLFFRPSALNDTSEWDFIFNKPHNYYLELLINLGVLGLLSYLFIMKRTLSSNLTKDNLAFKSCLISLYVSNFFGWPSVTTSLLFFIFAGFLMVGNGNE